MRRVYILFFTLLILSCNRYKIVEGTFTPDWGDSQEKFFAKDKKRLDQLFLRNQYAASYKGLSERGEVVIGHLFSPDFMHAVKAYQTSDSTMRTEVLFKNGKQWETALVHQSVSGFSDFMPFDGVIEIDDMDGDQMMDLRVVNYYWDIHPGNTGHLWVYKNGSFQFIEGFGEIVSPVYDKKSNRIYSYQADGCADMYMLMGTYSIENNKTIEEDFVGCDCCLYEEGICIIDRKENSDTVHISEAYKHVPAYFRGFIQDKLSIK